MEIIFTKKKWNHEADSYIEALIILTKGKKNNIQHLLLFWLYLEMDWTWMRSRSSSVFSSFASFDFSMLAFYHQRKFLFSIFEYYVIYLLQVWAFFDAFHKIQNCCVEWENLYIFSQVVWGLEKGFDSTLLANDKDTTTFLRPILILEPSVVTNKKNFNT